MKPAKIPDYKIGLIADAQVGYQQYGMLTRRDDMTMAFDWAISHLVAIGCRTIVLLGDTFHHNHPSALDMLNVIDALQWAKNRGAYLFAIKGNHDDDPPGSVSPISFLQEMRILHWDHHPGIGPGLHLMDWSGSATGNEVAGLIAQARDSTRPRILVGHAGIPTKTRGAGVIPETLIAPMMETFDLVALGHTHQRWSIYDKIISPGPLETTAIGEWACGPAVITISGNEVSYEFIDYPNARPFIVIDGSGEVEGKEYPATLYPFDKYPIQLMAENVGNEVIVIVNSYPDTNLGIIRSQAESYRPLKIIERPHFSLDDTGERTYDGNSTVLEDEAYKEVFGDEAGDVRELVELALSGRSPDEILSHLHLRQKEHSNGNKG